MITARVKPIHTRPLTGLDRLKKQRFCLYLLLVPVLMGIGCAPSSMPVETIETTVETRAVGQTMPPAGENMEVSPYYHYTLSELHKRNGEYDRALDELLKAVKTDPDSSFLKKELIALYLHKKMTPKALETAQNLVALEPENTDFLLILAKLRQMLNQVSEAKDIYLRIIHLDPEQENAYHPLGQIYMESDNTDEAYHLYTKMAKHLPDSYAAHFFLGRIHAIKNNPEYAEKEFLKTIKLNPDLLEPRFELISIYENPETPATIPKIITLYGEILEIDENNIRAGLELPLFYHHQGQETKASDLLARIGERSLEDQSIIMIASRELLGKKRFNDAAIVFSGMLKGAPEDSTLEYLAGISYDALKQTRRAIRHLLRVKPGSEYYKKSIVHIAFAYNENEQKEKAIGFLEVKHRELPEDRDIIIYLAAFYEEGEAYEEAIALLGEGVDLFPDNVDLIFRRGVVQDKYGQKQACIQSMKQVIEIDPDNANALNYLGYTYADMGENLDVAETLVAKALSLKPDDGFITDSLGWIYYRQGLFEKAAAILEKAVELTHGDPVITEHLGDAYLKLNRLEDALETYKKAISKRNDSSPALETKIQDLERQLDDRE